MDKGTSGSRRVSRLKRRATLQTAQHRQLAKNAVGYIRVSTTEQVESVDTYEGTHDIHTLILGQVVTGLAAFS